MVKRKVIEESSGVKKKKQLSSNISKDVSFLMRKHESKENCSNSSNTSSSSRGEDDNLNNSGEFLHMMSKAKIYKSTSIKNYFKEVTLNKTTDKNINSCDRKETHINTGRNDGKERNSRIDDGKTSQNECATIVESGNIVAQKVLHDLFKEKNCTRNENFPKNLDDLKSKFYVTSKDMGAVNDVCKSSNDGMSNLKEKIEEEMVCSSGEGIEEATVSSYDCGIQFDNINSIHMEGSNQSVKEMANVQQQPQLDLKIDNMELLKSVAVEDPCSEVFSVELGNNECNTQSNDISKETVEDLEQLKHVSEKEKNVKHPISYGKKDFINEKTMHMDNKIAFEDVPKFCEDPKNENAISNQELYLVPDIEDCVKPTNAFKQPIISSDKFTSEVDHFMDDWDLEESFITKNVDDLNLSTWQRCEVMQVNEAGHKKILLVRSFQTGSVTNCTLQGVWTACNISPGSTVCVKARCDNSSIWTVDNNDGFCIEFPDLLISPTAIVGSINCLRQGVLNYLFGKNSHSVDESSKILAIGCLVHELLQQVLTQGLDAPECIAMLVEEILASSHTVKLLYSSLMSLHEARNELLKVVPYIQKFCKLYSFGSQGTSSKNSPLSNELEKDAWQGEINSIIAIEDNYWIPELGLKGKIDVTVMAKEKGESENKMMPLELKTGAPKNSVEHRGQVILYCLMAKQLSLNVDGGLLVYLREGFARKVKVGRSEERDIVLLRNKLARYIAPIFTPQKSDTKEIKLPRPTNNARFCEWCPQREVCSTFLRASKDDEFYSKSSAQKLRTESIEHLTSEDINYMTRWFNLLCLEEKDKPRDSMSDLWCLPVHQRESKGRCVGKLRISEPVHFKEVDSYIHTFKRSNDSSELDITKSLISSGCMVLLSTDYRVAIAFGIILDIRESCVVVDVPRDLSQGLHIFGDAFSIDLYESQSYVHWVLGNLEAILENSERASNLRRLLIKCEIPSFDPIDSISDMNLKSLCTLNESQKYAIKRACVAKDYLLIRGLPGSGKSTTIAILIKELVSRGKSVLLTAHTHSAVDTVLLKLTSYEVPFLRIGAHNRVNEALHSRTEYTLTKHCSTPEDLDAVYKEQPVIAVTCLGVKHPLFTRHTFDVCIVDESSQVLQPVVLGPLLHAKKFVLVGDPEQLPPVVKSNIARDGGLSTSLFTHLEKYGGTVALDQQYRMNSKITKLANDLTYKGELKCGNASVAESTIVIDCEKIPEDRPLWSIRVLSSALEDSILFLDIKPSEVKSSNCTNKEEAVVVKKLADLFLQVGVVPESIGVIAPYTSQVRYLKTILQSNPGIEINTVDQYQGRDKEIIIFSCTNNWSINNTMKTDSGILHDKRRLTVAITRAKYKLIIIGSVSALQCFTPLKQIISSVGSQNIITVDH